VIDLGPFMQRVCVYSFRCRNTVKPFCQKMWQVTF